MSVVDEYETLLPEVVAAVRNAGAETLRQFSPDARRDGLADITAGVEANDAASMAFLREPLAKARPAAGLLEDEMATGDLPPGEWWVIDPVEGNVNHLHGMVDWCVTATLVRDSLPVLTVVHVPPTDVTYTAVRGRGAYQDGTPLRVSAKTRLDGALVVTGQASPHEGREMLRRTGESVAAMLSAALITRMFVPVNLQLVNVAAGRLDLFWQYSEVRSAAVAGALLVAEAGGVVTDTRGNPWSTAGEDLLASAPGLHAAALEVLSGVR